MGGAHSDQSLFIRDGSSHNRSCHAIAVALALCDYSCSSVCISRCPIHKSDDTRTGRHGQYQHYSGASQALLLSKCVHLQSRAQIGASPAQPQPSPAQAPQRRPAQDSPAPAQFSSSPAQPLRSASTAQSRPSAAPAEPSSAQLLRSPAH